MNGSSTLKCKYPSDSLETFTQILKVIGEAQADYKNNEQKTQTHSIHVKKNHVLLIIMIKQLLR